MFADHYSFKAPDEGLTTEQRAWMVGQFFLALGSARNFNVRELSGTDLSSMELFFDPDHALPIHEIISKFIQELVMHPVTKERGPLFNSPENYPRLITGAGQFLFTVTSSYNDLDRLYVSLQLVRLHKVVVDGKDDRWVRRSELVPA